MTLHGRLFTICFIGLFGCDPDPARSVKVATRSSASRYTTGLAPQRTVAADAAAARAETREGVPVEFQWRPDLCPPPEEPSRGPSTFDAKGACNFQQRGAVDCRSVADDFLVEISRPAAQGATLAIFVNVEKYHGPGKYSGGQMLVSVHDPKGTFRWRSDEVTITVGEGEKFAELALTRLEPLMTFGAGDITIVGKLSCATRTK